MPENNDVEHFEAKGDQTVAELAERFDLHANTIALWEAQLIDNASTAF